MKNPPLEWGAARALARLTFTPRDALLEELYVEKAHTGKFPSVREVEERVRLRQGKAPLPGVAPGDLPPVIDGLLARDVPIHVRSVHAKQTALEVTLRVPEGDESWLATIHPDTERR